ncbi:DEAD/DEAH box helicase [Jonesia quinghaiensis]|uniref:DEAD/DEAH box helicase n=1 Tax=Jonesia quinghaiensis TaxID=262806 RepID=UPI000417F8C8|nr:DEAD/DEAH box helicase [Jonesia quinghaiensis]
MPRNDELLDILTAGGRRNERLRHVHTINAQQGQTSQWPNWVNEDVAHALKERGAQEPWTHQVAAAQAAWDGHHVALATSTGSGKSLAYWVPTLSTIRASKDQSTRRIEHARHSVTALYLAPTKALAHDQHHALTQLLGAGNITDISAEPCDGDTPFESRRWIQAHGDIVLTNPDYLHYSLLPQHQRWSRFLRSLRYVIIDEGHVYRGVFGAHVALVLRRLRRLAAHYNGDEQLQCIVASATTAEPAASTARLIGETPETIRAITHDHSPRGRKTIALWQPPTLDLTNTQAPGTPTADDSPFSALLDSSAQWSAIDDDLTGPATPRGDDITGLLPDAPLPAAPRRSATSEATDLLADLTAHGARTLAFTRSRRAAEFVALHTQEALQHSMPRLANTVAAYRGGYLPEERRALEAQVRNGTIRCLATTNALELGIDISGLDAVAIIGWPGTRTSLWQQAGRAGRAGQDGLVVFIAREDPLDTYLVNNPDAIFGAPLEATIFDPHNPYVLGGHLCAAAAELPIKAHDVTRWFGGEAAHAVLDKLTARGTLRQRTSGWYWTHDSNAADFTSIRGDNTPTVQVVERSTGRLLGTVDGSAADGQVHDGAVYTHQGESYVVAHYDWEEGTALVDREVVAYSTWSRDVTSIEILDTGRTTTWQDTGVEWAWGQVNVHGQVTGFSRRRIPSGEILSNDTLDLPTRTLTTSAVWWTLTADLLTTAQLDLEEIPGALHAAEHAAIGLLPLIATCDRWDLGGVSTALHVDTEMATIFVYDALPGGAGFAERGFTQARQWMTATLSALTACGCADGCPSCVQSPKCGNGNNPLSKDGAIRLLHVMLHGSLNDTVQH